MDEQSFGLHSLTDSCLVCFPKRSVLGNQMFGNRLLGIGNQTSGRRVNDQNDIDSNLSNLGQNHPDISAFSVAGGLVSLSYRVDTATANAVYPRRVEFFKAAGDEGRSLLFSDSYLSTEAQSIKSLSNQPLPSGVSFLAEDMINIRATHDSYSGAFGGADGRDITVTGSFVIPAN